MHQLPVFLPVNCSKHRQVLNCGDPLPVSSLRLGVWAKAQMCQSSSRPTRFLSIRASSQETPNYSMFGTKDALNWTTKVGTQTKLHVIWQLNKGFLPCPLIPM
jgi:hypothetical protein